MATTSNYSNQNYSVRLANQLAQPEGDFFQEEGPNFFESDFSQGQGFDVGEPDPNTGGGGQYYPQQTQQGNGSDLPDYWANMNQPPTGYGGPSGFPQYGTPEWFQYFLGMPPEQSQPIIDAMEQGQREFAAGQYGGPNTGTGTYGSVLPGWDITKWNNPDHTTPKYVVGRILSNYPATPDGLKQALPDIQAQFPGATLVGTDKLNIPGVGIIDVGVNFNSGGTMSWAWQDTADTGGGVGGTYTGPGYQTYNYGAPGGANTISAYTVGQPIERLPQFQANPMVGDLNALAASLIQQAGEMAPLNRDPLMEQQKELLLALREQQVDANQLDATQRGIEGGVPSSRMNDIYDAFNAELANAYRDIEIAAQQQDLQNLLSVAGAGGGLGSSIFGQDLAAHQQSLADLLGVEGLNLQYNQLGQQESQFARNYALSLAQQELLAQQAYWDYLLRSTQ